MLSKSLETDIRAVEEHLFGTGTYTMFQRIKNELEELAQQPTNKPSAKCSVPGCNCDVKQFFCNQHLGIIGLRSTSHVG